MATPSATLHTEAAAATTAPENLTRFSALFAADADRTMTPSQLRCAETLCAVAAPYNLIVPGGSISSAVEFRPGGLSVLVANELATHDSGQLTALVVAAHRNCVRVSITAWTLPQEPSERDERIVTRLLEQLNDDSDHGPYTVDDLTVAGLEITLYARDPNNDTLYEGHPTLEDLAAATR